jgi:hypothetical protein
MWSSPRKGKGDEAALAAAVAIKADYIGFVGSRRKMAALKQEKLSGEAVYRTTPLCDRVKGSGRPGSRRDNA